DMPKRKRDALILENQDLRDAIKPREVWFYSLNFNNTLRWQPGRAGEGETTLYFVQYKQRDIHRHGTLVSALWEHSQGFSGLLCHTVYGQSKWQNKEECWGIQSHFCDLTEETSDAYEPYYGRVQAALDGVQSDWSLSCRFTPWRETMIGPPTIKVVHSNKFIKIKLQAPRSAYRRKRGSTIPMTNYYDLQYQVFIINNLLDEVMLVYEGKDKVIKIEDLKLGVSYCIVARTSVLALGRSSAYSSRRCIVLL
uniref:Interleukin 22 receptor subunit alpha 2 n=1 Tax=Coturnix japonica TaxID=93934 RepID=A0A8C2T8N2_COTJA